MDPEQVAVVNPTANPDTIHGTPQFKGKLYGVELEIEAAGLYEVEEKFNEDSESYESHDPCVPPGWLREQEDSIQGVELISEQPFDLDTSMRNIEMVFADINRMGYKPGRTPRGSTHVHANVADLTWDQMNSFVMACAWAEPALIALAGKGRKGNLFAQSYETSPLGWLPIINWCRQKQMLQSYDTHYMAVSFFPMTYLGSVEFRMGPSSRTAEEAIRWLSIIDTVVQAGRTQTVTGLTEPAFLRTLLCQLEPREAIRMRAKGAWQASEIWYALQEVYEAPKPRRGSKLGQLSPQNVGGYFGGPAPYDPYIGEQVPPPPSTPMSQAQATLNAMAAQMSADMDQEILNQMLANNVTWVNPLATYDSDELI